MTIRVIIARPMNHQEMVKYINTHRIKQGKGIITDRTMYNVENKYRQVEEGPESRRANIYFIDKRVIFPTVKPQLPQESISSLIQRPGAKDLLIS